MARILWRIRTRIGPTVIDLQLLTSLKLFALPFGIKVVRHLRSEGGVTPV